MDLGTANTLIYLKSKGIIINEPSVAAIDARSLKLIAVGKGAARMLGRAPKGIRVGRPLKGGVINDYDLAMAMIRGFLSAVFKPKPWLRSRIVIGIPAGITQVEKKAVLDSAYEAGAKSIHLIQEPLAAALGAGLDLEDPSGKMVVDIGGGTTEVAIISMVMTRYSKSIRVAGDVMDQAIARRIQKETHIDVTPEYAERIKLSIAEAYNPDPKKRMMVTGKDLTRGGPRTAQIDSVQVSRAIEGPVDTIIDTINSLLEEAPTVLLRDVQENGILLTGGGALLGNLDKLIEKMTGVRTYVAEEPLLCVAHGCGKVIEELDKWENALMV
jgi:rod shape-determining protein MreB